MGNRKKSLVFFTVYLAYTSVYIIRCNLSAAGPALLEEGILNTLQLGLLGSVFSAVYAVGRLFNGAISDRKPPWLMLTAGLCAAGLCNVLLSFFPPFAGIFLLWTGNAAAQSMLWSSVLCVVSGIYEGREAKRKTSLMVTSVALGNILGIAVNTWLTVSFGPRWAFAGPGLWILLLSPAVLQLTRSAEPAGTGDSGRGAFSALLRDKRIMTMGVPALLHGVMKENVVLWMTVFVVERCGIDLKASAGYVLLIPLVGFCGRLLYSPIYRLCGENENRVSLIGFAICALCALLLGLLPMGALGCVACLGAIYMACSVINSSVISIFPLSYSSQGNVASVSGIMDFAAYLGAGIFSAVYGVVISRWGYTPMFLSWLLLSLIALLSVIKAEQLRKKHI